MSEKVINCIETIVSWQGENQDSGKRMFILRFKRCNRIEAGKGCRWCDTKTKLRISAEYSITLNEIQKILDKEKCGILITGGCPTYSTNFNQTLLMLNNLKYSIANVESNGHRLIELVKLSNLDKPINFSYSPKIFTLDELHTEIEKSKELSKYSNVYFKIVYEDNELINQYLDFVETLEINPRVFLMPEGETREKLIKNSPVVFDAAELYKFNFSSRNHIIYGFI